MSLYAHMLARKLERRAADAQLGPDVALDGMTLAQYRAARGLPPRPYMSAADRNRRRAEARRALQRLAL